MKTSQEMLLYFLLPISFIYFWGCDRNSDRRITTASTVGAAYPTSPSGYVFYTATPTQYNGNSCDNIAWSSCVNNIQQKYCNGAYQTRTCGNGNATATPTATATATGSVGPVTPSPTPAKIAVRTLLDSIPQPNQVVFDTATIGKKGSCNFGEFQNLHTPERTFLNSKGCSPNSYVLCVKHRSGDIVDLGRDYVGIPGIADNGNNEFSRSYTIVRDHADDSNNTIPIVAALYEICLTQQEYDNNFKNFSGELKIETRVAPEQGIVRHVYGDWCDKNRNSNNGARWGCRTSWEKIPKSTYLKITNEKLDSFGFPVTNILLDFTSSGSSNTKKLTFNSALETTRSNDNGNYGCEVRCAGSSSWNNTAKACLNWNPFAGEGWGSNDSWFWQVGRADDGLPVCAKWAKSERCKPQSCPTGNIYFDVNRQPWCIESTINGIHRAWRPGYPKIQGVMCN